MRPIHIIGGGLAGSEAAWQAANFGVPAVIHEMRPHRTTAAHRTPHLAELVCSNSFRSDDSSTNAVGVLHREMRALGSIVLKSADGHQVPAGGALAVDRDGFSQAVEAAVLGHPLITLDRGEIASLPPADWDNVIIATGPLTSPALAEAIGALNGEGALAFFDAIAPIVHRHSIDMDVAWMQSRYDKEGPGGAGGAYVNCPMTRDQYGAFIDALLEAEKTEFREFEGTPYFDGCLPIEVMAERGTRDPAPRTDETVRAHQRPRSQGQALRGRPAQAGQRARHAVQHRRLPDQAQIWRTGAHFPHDSGARKRGVRPARRHPPQHLSQLAPPARCASSPEALASPQFAGQITGCEGYVESAAIGLIAGRLAAAERLGPELEPPPPTTAIGALLGHITGGHIESVDAGPRSFQPMNVNFGLFPPIAEPRFDEAGKRLAGPERGLARKRALSARAERDLAAWMDGARERAPFVEA